jgi:N-acetylglucosamine kinase-like BadF-type ATPase
MEGAGMKTLGGIDGGGSRTRLALAGEDGTVLGVAEAGCCSFVELGRARARQALGELWRKGWESAKAEPHAVDALFIGTGSILSEEDERTNCELGYDLGLATQGKIRAGNDAFNALAGGLSGRPGILLISGTGSACLGRNAQGKIWRAGGWGHLLQDVGSAYALGLGAMVAATRDADGRGEPTALTDLVREALGLRDLKEIYRKLHEPGISRAEIAALASRVITCAQEGDSVAQQLVREGVDGLVKMVTTVAERLGLAQPELALTGGLINNSDSFRQSFKARIAHELPGVRFSGSGLAPVLGAVMLALELATGITPTADFLENLRRSALRFAGAGVS